MIDTASFLNSKDIADYWYKIGRNSYCTPLQSAYIIYKSRDKTLKEKHAAWKELMETTPDCSVAEGSRKERMGLSDALSNSLHAFLKAYMALEERLYGDLIYRGDHACAVYFYRTYYKGDRDWHEDRRIFRMHDDCLRAAKEDDPDLLYIEITKQWIDSEERLEALMRGDGTLLSFDAEGLPEADSDLFQAFEWLWFDFPTPFRRGDIVVSPHSFFGYRVGGEEPFVLTSLSSWGEEEMLQNGYDAKEAEYAQKRLSRQRESADGTDMTAHGYFQLEDGTIWAECMHDYLDLAYYREEPTGIRRILKLFSAFEKGEIDAELLAKGYHILLTEAELEQKREALDCFLDETQKKAGLK